EKSAPGAPIAPAAPAPKPAADASMKATPIPITSSFAAVKSKADKAESPILAVSLWEKFIESNPSADELAAAKVELAKWQQLEKDKAEKINGKWVGGDEKKKLLKQVNDLIREGSQELNGNQFVAGVKKLEDAIKLYPNSFEANF